MQYLATVHDGSEHELGNGYWTCNVVATEVGDSKIVPLVSRLYSADAPEFISENRELLTHFPQLFSKTSRKTTEQLARMASIDDMKSRISGKRM